jgi:hypothetical protein
MKKMKLLSLVLIAGFAISGISLQAHHSVKAVMTPARWLHLPDSSRSSIGESSRLDHHGRQDKWPEHSLARAARCSGALSKAGLDKTTFDFSKPISIEVWLAKNDPPGSHHANGQTLTMPDGRKFDVSDKWDMLAINGPRTEVILPSELFGR